MPSPSDTSQFDEVAGVANGDAPWAARTVPGLAALIVLAWVGLMIATSSGQWGDHFEQFVWAHGVEWGYHKHPPLPTWMLAAVIGAFGPSVRWPVALAAACVLGTVFFTYRITRMLADEAVATLALLLMGLQYEFSERASLFNHNTLMLLMVSATVWCALHALRSVRRTTVWWGLTGVVAALAMLAKYQSIVPLGGLVVGAMVAGDLAPRQARRGLLLAIGIAALLLTPHLLWLLNGHTAAIDYATQQGRTLPWAARGWNVTSFLAQQLRMQIGPLLLFGLLRLWPGPRATGGDAQARRLRGWLLGLIGFPLCITVLTGPLFGIALQNHWGYQPLQFVSLWLAWHLLPRAPMARRAWVIVALLLQCASVVVVMSTATSVGQGMARSDNRFPAQALADAVARDWRRHTACPLALVVGPTFEAGIVSAYNGGTARVLEEGDFEKSPWITPDDLRRLGAVYVSTAIDKLPRSEGSAPASMDVSIASAPPRDHVYWAITPPAVCAGAAVIDAQRRDGGATATSAGSRAPGP